MKTQDFVPMNPASAAWGSSQGHQELPAEQIVLIDHRSDSMNLVVRAEPLARDRVPGTSTRRSSPLRGASHHWGLVLAGGDGVRLKELTRWISGDDRPKQFCPLLGSRTMFEATRQRAEKSLSPDHIIFLLTRAHETYFRGLFDSQSTKRIVQPYNRGTAPAILCGLIAIARSDPDAIVSILPSDHYFSPEAAFQAGLGEALELADQYSDSIVLLGVLPKAPETEYGWIEVGSAVNSSRGLYRVERFLEKPPVAMAQRLYRNGSLWNTFVMAGRVQAFLEIASATLASLLETLVSQADVSSPGPELRIPDRVYDQVAPTDFSTSVLARATGRLLGLRLENIDWSDLGDPYRLLATLLEENGTLPAWATLWPQREDAPRAAVAGD